MTFLDIIADKAASIHPDTPLRELMASPHKPGHHKAITKIIREGGFCLSAAMLSDVFGLKRQVLLDILKNTKHNFSW